ncbi:MAG: radical SAM protein [Candidatus Competibacter sp.]
MIDSLTSPDEQRTLDTQYVALSVQKRLLPVKITSFYRRKVTEEISILRHTDGPLHRAVFPSRERLMLRAPGEVPDFVHDRDNMEALVGGTIIRKYHNRILFLPTSECISNCQYCFRQDMLSEKKQEESLLQERLRGLLEYLSDRPEIYEVILSGGDPMMLSFGKLKEVLEGIASVGTIQAVRMHTRGMIFNPRVFTEDKMSLLGEHRVRVVHHSIHPYEICDEVQRCIDRLHTYNVRLYNQFPILRKINDHIEVLTRHLHILDSHGIRNLSIFIPDAIHYSAAFRMSIDRLFHIMDDFNKQTPAWINSTRFVLDTPYGKVRREDMVSYNDETGEAVFERSGHLISYLGLPKHMDEPGNLATLLWRDSSLNHA